ncbi:hypothetical protein JTE90_013924 [Oedothorax gibbosus]|uniref:BTB domain-containing protein n=1 Tax=Oedothorax gibbosus TaxID=931172 RepID=A0AAV6V180_9ARAC|nr:hypothetical protein JTE90_013924 [Oedothorax gibbosus]
MLSDSKENLQADRNDEEEIKSEFQISSELNETEEPPIADIPFPMITNFPDVVVQVGKDHKFPTTKKVLCDYSDYFYQRLASNKERLCVLKVDEQFVNPEAFKTILRFLCFKQPFSSQNLTTEVIRTATYLRMPLIICKIEMGSKGVEKVINILKDGFKNAMLHAGFARPSEITKSSVVSQWIYKISSNRTNAFSFSLDLKRSRRINSNVVPSLVKCESQGKGETAEINPEQKFRPESRHFPGNSALSTLTQPNHASKFRTGVK